MMLSNRRAAEAAKLRKWKTGTPKHLKITPINSSKAANSELLHQLLLTTSAKQAP